MVTSNPRQIGGLPVRVKSARMASSLRRLSQARTIVRNTQRVAWAFRTLASTASLDGSPPVTATNRKWPSRTSALFVNSPTRAGAEATLKRFWKTVDLEERGDTLAITLDSRPLKTPGGEPLLLPRSKRLAATLIATEWENQRNVLKSHALPMVCRAQSQAALCPSVNVCEGRPRWQHVR